MAFLSEMERRAFESRDARQQPPERALLAMADDIQAGKVKGLCHLIVISVRDDDGMDLMDIMQSGSLTGLAVEGALSRAIVIHRQSLGSDE